MKDTDPSVEARVRQLLMQRAGDERVRMACEMFDLARALAVASLAAANPGLGPAELRAQVFERMYGGDLEPPLHASVIKRLRS